MRKVRLQFILVLACSVLAFVTLLSAQSGRGLVGVNVVLNDEITPARLKNLAAFGKVRDIIPAIRAVTLQTTADQLPLLRALPFVAGANPDAFRKGAPIDTVPVQDFENGLSTWNLDAINVTDFGFDNRTVSYDGTGVIVAVLDSGLLDSWRQYFPQERILTQYAVSFGGGGGLAATVSQQPGKWEHDQDSHGTHVTSTILGYSLVGTPVNGVAPQASVIPVKVLNQNGSGWSSVIARGITYIADLKAGPLAGLPVVINLSLGGPAMDTMEKAAIDYAIEQGVVVVAAAGNSGEGGMDYPGAYAPVISVAAAGWIGEWPPGNNRWWHSLDLADPTNPGDFYITDFSSRALFGQDLDVAAPGSWVVGPYQTNSGQLSYFFLGGTSMSCPHVAGIAALILQKNPTMTASDVETILEASAIPLPPGCRTVSTPTGIMFEICWGADATGAGLADAEAALALTP